MKRRLWIAEIQEILPITYSDNYLTLLPHESRTIVAEYHAKPDETAALRIEGYNVDSQTISVGQSDKKIGTKH
jgi:mannosylglycoprotein endo-beta-mannosidase